MFNSCRKTPACLDGKLMASDLEAGSESPEPASDLRKLVGDTGIEPVTSSVSRARGWANSTRLPTRVGRRWPGGLQQAAHQDIVGLGGLLGVDA